MAEVVLKILRPFEQQSVIVDWVYIIGPDSSFLVGEDHLPLISTIRGGTILTYQTQGSEKHVEIPDYGGIVHVIRNQILVFL